MKKNFFLILVLFFVVSCEENSFNSQYEFMYGDWTPVQLSVGLNYSAEPQLLGDIIQILKNDSYKVIRNDKVVESGKIKIETQTEDDLSLKFDPKELDFGSDSFIRLSHSTLNVKIFSQDSILLRNTATDGGSFGLYLKRKE